MTLHITNGDCAAERIATARIGGEILPWRDVLHEGPVPGGLTLRELSAVRARFIAGTGWGDAGEVARDFAARDASLERFAEHDEVVLWFEHDLYDQLQLIQLLDWFATRPRGDTRLTLVQADEYLGPIALEKMAPLFAARRPVTEEQLALGRDAWRAFRSPDPRALLQLLARDTGALPFLAGALARHLEQFPSTRGGLSRGERQALDAIAAGRRVLGDAFVAATQEREERIFIGDATFASWLARMSGARTPLVRFDDGGAIEPPHAHGDRAFWSRAAVVTDAGHDVLRGDADAVALNGIDHWLGGVHLASGGTLWRWDGEARALRESVA